MAHSGLDGIAFKAGRDDGRYGRGNLNPYNQSLLRQTWLAYEEGYAEGESIRANSGAAVPVPGGQGPPGPQGPPGGGTGTGTDLGALLHARV